MLDAALIFRGAAMSKLLHIVFGVLKSGRPFNRNHHPLRLDSQHGIYLVIGQNRVHRRIAIVDVVI